MLDERGVDHVALLDVMEVDYKGQRRRIELHQGDLSAISPEDAVDLLVLSAFPNDYVPTRSSLIGALFRNGVSVEALSFNKAVDLRAAFSCWLSHPLHDTNLGIEFKRILCFEPLVRGSPPDVIGDIFRALSPFLADDPPIRTVAMPILAAGDQAYPISTMLEPLIEAAVNWLGIGLPLETLKIFAYSNSDAKEAATTFKQLKVRFSRPALSTASFTHDVFISYSRKDATAGETLASLLQKYGKRVYIDVLSLKKGAAWQPKIFAALDTCAKVVAFYSPDYIQSKICQEEFNIAWTRARNEETQVIFPIYWKSTELPTYMGMLNFVDCREAKEENLSLACSELVSALNKHS